VLALATERSLATFDRCEQQQHQADQQQDMHEVSQAVQAKDAQQPRDQQNQSHLEEHLASGHAASVERGMFGCAMEWRGEMAGKLEPAD
jgi:hypothetical protein